VLGGRVPAQLELARHEPLYLRLIVGCRPSNTLDALRTERNSDVVPLATTDSNIWSSDSSWVYTLTPRNDGGTDIDVVLTRTGRSAKGGFHRTPQRGAQISPRNDLRRSQKQSSRAELIRRPDRPARCGRGPLLRVLKANRAGENDPPVNGQCRCTISKLVRHQEHAGADRCSPERAPPAETADGVSEGDQARGGPSG
jgi:hypothetical protein